VSVAAAKKQEMLKKHKEELQKCQGRQHNLAYVNAHIKRDLLVRFTFYIDATLKAPQCQLNLDNFYVLQRHDKPAIYKYIVDGRLHVLKIFFIWFSFYCSFNIWNFNIYSQ